MKVLVLNGSPKGEKSNTFRITRAFLEGLEEIESCSVNIVNISEKNIEHCRGCFACWTKTPGKCIIRDDMRELIESYVTSDVVIWSFPLYYFGMPSKVKAFLDRMLPTNLPYMSLNKDGTSGHPSRYDLSNQRYVLISTCGFYSTKKNYDALFKQFDILFGDKLSKIICPEGELFHVSQLEGRILEYLSYAKQAGREFGYNSAISSDTKDELGKLLYPPDVFVEMANASWNISEGSMEKRQQQDRSYNFMKQMAAVYNPKSYTKDVLIEIYFTDIDKTYQLFLGREKCTVNTENFVTYTTRIETTFELWKKISEGKVNGAKALMKKQYRVLGDFSIMLKMDGYSGIKSQIPEKKSAGNKTNMTLLLFQWIALWVVLPIDEIWGGVVGIIVCSVIPLLSYKFKLTIYDEISIPLICVLGILAVFGTNPTFLICLSYLIFGFMWILSCWGKIPLTAYYSCNDYNGKDAFENPLFLKTNRILTAAWGVLFLIIAFCTYFLMGSVLSSYTGLVNSIAPAVMGAFTKWFASWYPAKVARG
ncbi:Azoreductase [Clostridiaceae bacterium BL-3]|nr:Azoreductase [Clostridiaceae bacterium BL-3]